MDDHNPVPPNQRAWALKLTQEEWDVLVTICQTFLMLDRAVSRVTEAQLDLCHRIIREI